MIPSHSATAPFSVPGVLDEEEEVGEPLKAAREDIVPDQEENRS